MTYTVRRKGNSYGTEFDTYELEDTETGSKVSVCPERGGLVVSFAPNGRELLYLDEQTFAQKDANVRGGIPILWPICGQLADGQYEWDGNTYQMPQHGLARRLPWTVVDESTENHASITLALKSSEETKRMFPFDFELRFTYKLDHGQLTIDQTYTNLSPVPMPMYAGFHPYFLSPTKRLNYETDATTYLDFNDNSENLFTGVIDLEGRVESVVLQGASTPKVSFGVLGTGTEVDGGLDASTHGATDAPDSPEVRVEAGARMVTLEYGSEFPYVVVWHVQGKPFVCVEPWMALPGALQSGKELTMVEPHQSFQTFMKISSSDSI